MSRHPFGWGRVATRMIARRGLVGCAIAVLSLATIGLLAPSIAIGQSPLGSAWPERPVRIIVPFPAGGAADVLTRVTPNETVAFVERERQKWGEVVRASGAKVE